MKTVLLRLLNISMGMAMAASVAPVASHADTALTPFFIRGGESKSISSLRLTLKTDGSLQLLRGTRVLWTSGTTGRNCTSGCVARFQSDGNLVLYRNSVAYWSTRTSGYPGASLIISETQPYIRVRSQPGIRTVMGVRVPYNNVLLWSSSPEPLPVVINGAVDGVSINYDGSAQITGWACATGISTPLDVHVYLGGGYPQGRILKAGKANLVNPAVNQPVCARNNQNYAFSIPMSPAERRLHRGKTVFVHAISPVRGNNPLLRNSGQFAVPVENGALNRAEVDDLSSGWSESQTVLSGFVNMYNPKILKTGNADYPYEMWFFGWAAQVCNQPLATASYCDSIFYARARSVYGPWQVYSGDVNGQAQFDRTNDVTKWKPVLHCRNLFWDNWHNGDPSVVKANGTYFMAYSQTGMNQNGRFPQVLPDGANNETIGGAFSSDGIHWTRLERPLLASSHDPLDGSMAVGTHFARPSLLYENSKFRLWFDYWAGADGLSMGYAELSAPATADGFTNQAFSLIQGDAIPAIAQWPNPNVTHIGDLYISFSDSLSLWMPGGQWAMRQTSVAVSHDGLQWTVVGQIPADPDCIANMVPELLVDGDMLYLGTGCVPKSGPADSAEMTSIRLRSISLPRFIESMAQVRPEFFEGYSIPRQPACTASSTDQTFLQTSETYFSGARTALPSNSQPIADRCYNDVKSTLITLRSSNWSCIETSAAVERVKSCLADIKKADDDRRALEAQKIAAGQAFVQAFGNLLRARQNGATGSLLDPFTNACIATQNNARNWGVFGVDSYPCR